MTLQQAQQLEDDEQFEKAYEVYKTILTKQPKNLEALEGLAHLCITLKKTDEAIINYEKLLELDMTNIVAHEQLMDLYYDVDRFKYYLSRGNRHTLENKLSHAINDFKKAIDKAEDVDQANSTRFVLATLYEQLNKPNNAIDEYLRILDTENKSEIVFLRLAKIYESQDTLSSAIETLERAVEQGFDTADIKEYLANSYLKNGNTEHARKYSTDKLLTIKSFLDEEKNEDAFKLLQEIEKDYKKNPKFHSLMAQYYFNTNDFDKALECVLEFEKFDKNSPLGYQMRALIFEEKENDFEAHYNWGKYYLIKGEKDIALNEYMQADRLDDKNPDLIYTIATLQEALNDKHQAMEFYERFVKLEPQNKSVLKKLGEFKESIGDKTQALNYYEKLLTLCKGAELKEIEEKINNLENAADGFIDKILSLFKSK